MSTNPQIDRRRPGPGRVPDAASSLVFLYLGTPLIMGVIMGWHRVALPQSVPFSAALVFWVAFALAIWLGAALGSAVVHRVLRPWRPPVWVVTLLGALLAGFVFALPYRALLSAGQVFAPSGAAAMSPLAISPSFDFALRFTKDILPGTLLWVGVNHVYDRILGIPRYRYAAPSPAAAGESDVAPLVSLLPREKRGRLLAIKAEDHYLRIFTDAGDHLVYMRLGDALENLVDQGMRTHRSWWVAFDAVDALKRERASHVLELHNGLRVPVSRTYLLAVKAHLSDSGARAGQPAMR